MTDKSEPCFTERARTCLFITRISFKENVFSNYVELPSIWKFTRKHQNKLS